eukprot:scaffold2485_cov130-Skeletonema_marinoi.AAC.3
MMVVAEGGRGVVAVVRKKSYMRQIMNCEEEKIRESYIFNNERSQSAIEERITSSQSNYVIIMRDCIGCIVALRIVRCRGGTIPIGRLCLPFGIWRSSGDHLAMARRDRVTVRKSSSAKRNRYSNNGKAKAQPRSDITARSMNKILTVAVVASLLLPSAVSFSPSSTNNNIHANRRPKSLSQLQCICIHCKYVTNCSAYHFVEQQHGQPHINKTPTWEPRDGSPTINVHIRPDEDKTTEDELGKMWQEHEEETRRAEESYAESNDGKHAEEEDAALFGSTQYDLSGTTSYEYDVIECEDFVEQKDMWVKNMPDEIRLANPDFVPT